MRSLIHLNLVSPRWPTQQSTAMAVFCKTLSMKAKPTLSAFSWSLGKVLNFKLHNMNDHEYSPIKTILQGGRRNQHRRAKDVTNGNRPLKRPDRNSEHTIRGNWRSS